MVGWRDEERQVDAADFKTYIFSLLSFKRTCDASNAEITTDLEESDGYQEYV